MKKIHKNANNGWKSDNGNYMYIQNRKNSM